MIAFDSRDLLSDPPMIWLADAPALPPAGSIAQVLPWLTAHLGLQPDVMALSGLDAAAFAQDPDRTLQALQRLGCDTYIGHTSPVQLMPADLPAVLTLATGDACVVTALHGRPGEARRCEVVVFTPEPMAFAVTDTELAGECVGPGLLMRRVQGRRAAPAATAAPVATPPATAGRPGVPPVARAPSVPSPTGPAPLVPTPSPAPRAAPMATSAAGRPLVPEDLPVLDDVIELPLPRWNLAQAPAQPPMPLQTLPPTQALPPTHTPTQTQAQTLPRDTVPAQARTPSPRPIPDLADTPALAPEPVARADAAQDGVVLDLRFLDDHSGAAQMRRQFVGRLRRVQVWVGALVRRLRLRGPSATVAWAATPRREPQPAASTNVWREPLPEPGWDPGLDRSAGLARHARHEPMLADPPTADRRTTAPPGGAAVLRWRDTAIDRRWLLDAADAPPDRRSTPPPAQSARRGVRLSVPGWPRWSQPLQALQALRRPRTTQSPQSVQRHRPQRSPQWAAWRQWTRWPQWARWPAGRLGAPPPGLAAVVAGDPGAATVGLAPAPTAQTAQTAPTGTLVARLAGLWPALWPAHRRAVDSGARVTAGDRLPSGPGQPARAQRARAAPPWASWAPWAAALPVEAWRRRVRTLPVNAVDALVEASVTVACLAQGLPLAWGRATVRDGLWAPLRHACLNASLRPRAAPAPARPVPRTIPQAATLATDRADTAAASLRPAARGRVYAVDFASALRQRSDNAVVGPPRPARLPPPGRSGGGGGGSGGSGSGSGLPGHRLMAA
ncbi:hypothetical protein AACH10_01575 [Ideonella sp. DXS22W]|uniref:Uncharacterized protein n=1 Tax=Pseudaquabacterium inlustre TaxID=2984192 RepID=A0ABU9CEJ1_9BURK